MAGEERSTSFAQSAVEVYLPVQLVKCPFLFKKCVYQKSKERQATFNFKSKKAKMDEFVTITILIGFLLCGDLKPVRGMKSPSPKI